MSHDPEYGFRQKDVGRVITRQRDGQRFRILVVHGWPRCRLVLQPVTTDDPDALNVADTITRAMGTVKGWTYGR